MKEFSTLNDALKTTFELLTKTHNEAAVAVLITALDSQHEEIQLDALAALLERRSPQGHHEIVSRLHDMDSHFQEVISGRCERLTPAIRDAMLGDDPQICNNGYDATLRFKDFDQIPTLVSASEDKSYTHADRAAKTLLKLTELMHKELTSNSKTSSRHNPLVVRRLATEAIEKSVSRFGQHQCQEILESFCILTKRKNATLKRILQSPYEKAFLPLIEILNQSSHPGIIQLILSFLDDSRAPSSVLNIISHRCDTAFLQHLAKKIASDSSPTTQANYKHMTKIPWALEQQETLKSVDSEQQFHIMQMISFSGMKRLDVFQVIEYLMKHGKPGGRQAASGALAEFTGGKANELCEKAMADPDPQVQANAMSQIRTRGISGALSTLIEGIDSPHKEVREAARGSLSEYSFQRYLGSFDTMEDNVRESSGKLVKKIDLQTIPMLMAELKNPGRTHRLRALEIAEVIDAIQDLEATLIAQLTDDDHIIRAECARLLVQCNTPETRGALRELLWDKSVIVQEAAERSLDELSKTPEPDQLPDETTTEQPTTALENKEQSE